MAAPCTLRSLSTFRSRPAASGPAPVLPRSAGVLVFPLARAHFNARQVPVSRFRASAPPLHHAAAAGSSTSGATFQDDGVGGRPSRGEEVAATEASIAPNPGEDPVLTSARMVAWESLKKLTPAELKALRAHAHRLGPALVMQQVGKWGVTPAVVQALDVALEANEILKVKVSENSPDELADTGAELEERLKARVVGQIGRALLVYRPSISLITGESGSSRRRGRRKRSSG